MVKTATTIIRTIALLPGKAHSPTSSRTWISLGSTIPKPNIIQAGVISPRSAARKPRNDKTLIWAQPNSSTGTKNRYAALENATAPIMQNTRNTRRCPSGLSNTENNSIEHTSITIASTVPSLNRANSDGTAICMARNIVATKAVRLRRILKARFI